MQLRTLALLCSIVGFLYSGLASALGLGEITLKSQYNQPLNAEIRLLKVRDLSEEEILAELASREDFRRAGVERVFFLTGLNFEVVLDSPSNPFIRVTSRKPVTEPYLNFLLEVQWPSGRLLREYTLLLDLPVFTEAAPSNTVVSRPTTSTPTTVRSEPAPTSSSSQYQPSSSRPVVSGPEPTASDASSSSGYAQSSPDSYRVRSGDTLWEIAENVRPDSSVSVHQTMIALQEANPEAFVGGNINRLKNGKVLRVPSSSEINNISYNRAVSTVRQQNESWSSRSNNRKAVLTSAAPTTTTESGSSQPEGRLTLAAADSGQGDVRGAGASGSGESLQNELSIAKDELSKTARENNELKSRIADLESQIETMEKLVSVTNDQLKALQLAAQSKGEEAVAAADESVDQTNNESVVEAAMPETPDATADSQVEEGQQSGESGAESVEGVAGSTEESTQDTQEVTQEETPATEALATESPTVEYEEPVVEEPVVEEPVVETPPVAAPVVTPPVVEKPGFDLLGIIKNNLIAVGGVLAALLVGILVLLRLREKPEAPDYGEFDLAEEEDVFEGEGFDQPEDIADETELDLDEEEDVEAQTEDVVAEADIYVSLGQEDKAIELLQKEIQQNPDNADARLGLLKIYAKAQNSEAFDEQYAQLLPLGNVYANDQAMALRKEISDVEPFDTDQYSAGADGEDAFESLNLGDDLEDELNLDLDLNDDINSVDAEESLASSESESEASFLSSDTDTDLDLDTDLNVDIGDLSLDLDDVDGNLDDLDLDSGDGSLPISDLDGDGELSLDLDLDTGTEESNLVDEMSADLDKLDVEDTNLDDLEIDIDGDLDALDEDLSLAAEEVSAAGDLEFDLDFESADAALDSEPSVEASEDNKIEDELDLDAPPLEDIDLASLDEEIDAMTADLDETLPLDEDEPEAPNLEDELAIDDPFSGSNLDLDSLDSDGDQVESAADDLDSLSLETDIDEAADSVVESAEAELTGLDVEAELPIAEDDFASLEDSSEDDIDILSKSEMDDLVADNSDDTSVEDLAGDDVSVSSIMDDASIAEDEELDFLEASDEVSTKLDLAKAYIDMGDREGAEDILNEVIEEGNDSQKSEAEELKRSI